MVGTVETDDSEARVGEVAREVALEAGEAMDSSDEERALLVEWLDARVEGGPVWRRFRRTPGDPTWRVLDPAVFDGLSAREVSLLGAIVETGEVGREGPLPEEVAASAVALWCHGRDEELRREARRLLEARPLPGERAWLWQLVRHFERIGRARGDRRPGLFQVAALQLGSGFWKVAADLASLYLVRRTAPGGEPPDDRWMTEACDRAARQRWRLLGDWIELAAEAARGGELGDPWLERVVAAALRRTAGEGRVHRRLARYHAGRPYEADRARLYELYRHALEALVGRSPVNRNWARRYLYEELEATAPVHPHRAVELAELMLVYERPLPWRPFRSQIRHALRQVAARESLGFHERLLARLYVETFSAEPAAQRFVDQVRDRIDWEAGPVGSRRKLEAYDDVFGEEAIHETRVTYAGTEMDLVDKDAATNAIYYAEKPLAPNRLLRSLRRLLSPIDALGTSGDKSALLRNVVVRAVGWIDACFGGVDRRERTVDTFARAGVAVDDFEDIGDVGLEYIEGEFDSLLVRRLVVAALGGGISGALGGAGYRWAALAGVPMVLATVLEAASRYCWIYGFDPLEHPEIPLEILAVAVEGPCPDPPVRDELYHEMAESAVHTSFVVEAVATRNVARLVGRALGGVTRMLARSDHGREVASRIERMSRKTFGDEYGDWIGELVGAGLGAASDAAIVYDVSEAAEVVLTDRFLDRKYEDWERRLGPRVDAEGEADLPPTFPGQRGAS